MDTKWAADFEGIQPHIDSKKSEINQLIDDFHDWFYDLLKDE